MEIRLTVNGREHHAQIADPDMGLLFYLRNVMGLTAAKNGCGEGHCGACTVIIDGKAELSCLKKMKSLNGKRVVTLEALSTEHSIHPLQYAFIMEGAIQCGFCTPGMIMAAKALLDENPDPGEHGIRRALSRNICRCTGYVKIIKAVRRASELIRQGRDKISREEVCPSGGAVFGKPVPRVDGPAKATGEIKFSDDIYFENMLYAGVFRSDYPHAEILHIDCSEALKTEGVAAVLTAEDIPGKNAFGLIIQDQPVFAHTKVRWVGDALAAVYAKSERIAEEALSKIRVKYRPLPVVNNPKQALSQDAPLLHEHEHEHKNGKGSNIFSHMQSGRGDVNKGFEQADIILEDDYYTPFIEHAYMEPESGVAVPEEDGRISVYVGSQGPPDDIRQIAPALDIAPEKIHIAHRPLGGGFGGKEDITVQLLQPSAP